MTTDRFTVAARSGLPLKDDLVVDAHGHIGQTGGFPIVSSSLESVIANMDRIGIDIFCASAFPAFQGAASKGNDMMLQAIEAYPGRVFGYMGCDIGYPKQLEREMERCYQLGFRAIKIWNSVDRPDFSNYNHPNYERVYEFANNYGLPILAHTWGSELDHLESAICKYGQITWLFAHSGTREVDKYVRFAKDFQNVYLETCLSACPRGLIEHFVDADLLDKVIWGSDAVYLNAAHQVGRVLYARLSEVEKAKILGKNAIMALGLKKWLSGLKKESA